MLINEAAIILNLLSIAFIGLFAAVAMLTLVWQFSARHITRFSAGILKKTLWLFVATPWAVGIICVLVFLPALFQPENALWLGRLAHWHHPYVFYLDSWHGATLFMFILGAVYVPTRKGLNTVRHLNALGLLTRLSRKNARRWKIERDIIVLESKTPSAFAAGLFSPKCYVTTGLIEQVSETGLGIIIDHERAHIKHRDTQKKLIFTLLASLYPRPVALRLNRSFPWGYCLLIMALTTIMSSAGVDGLHHLIEAVFFH